MEHDVLYNLENFLCPGVTFSKNTVVKTIGNTFLVPLLVTYKGYSIAIECNEERLGLSDESDLYFEWKDALVLETGIANMVYRFCPSGVAVGAEAIVSTMNHFEPLLFIVPYINDAYLITGNKEHGVIKILKNGNKDAMINCCIRDLKKNRSPNAIKGLLLTAKYPTKPLKNICTATFRQAHLNIPEIIWYLRDYDQALLLRLMPYIAFTDLENDARTIDLVFKYKSAQGS